MATQRSVEWWADRYHRAKKRIAELGAQVVEARSFAEDAAAKYNALLVEATTVTCAFCGKRFPRGAPRHGDGVLTAHIRECTDHPMRGLEYALTHLVQFVRECCSVPKMYDDRKVGCLHAADQALHADTESAGSEGDTAHPCGGATRLP